MFPSGLISYSDAVFMSLYIFFMNLKKIYAMTQLKNMKYDGCNAKPCTSLTRIVKLRASGKEG